MVVNFAGSTNSSGVAFWGLDVTVRLNVAKFSSLKSKVLDSWSDSNKGGTVSCARRVQALDDISHESFLTKNGQVTFVLSHKKVPDTGV